MIVGGNSKFLIFYGMPPITTFISFQQQSMTVPEVKNKTNDSANGLNWTKQQRQYQSRHSTSFLEKGCGRRENATPSTSYYLNHLRVRKQSLTYRGAMLSIPR